MTAVDALSYLLETGIVTDWRQDDREFWLRIPGCWQRMTAGELGEFAENQRALVEYGRLAVTV